MSSLLLITATLAEGIADMRRGAPNSSGEPRGKAIDRGDLGGLIGMNDLGVNRLDASSAVVNTNGDGLEPVPRDRVRTVPDTGDSTLRGGSLASIEMGEPMGMRSNSVPTAGSALTSGDDRDTERSTVIPAKGDRDIDPPLGDMG